METPARSRRDPRIDVLRGLALLMLFVDHVPGDKLGFVTLHMVGFSDAAEFFVILAGCSAMIAYGRVFERDGMASGLRKVAARCLRLYLYQAGLLLLTLAVVSLWAIRHDIQIPELLRFLGVAKGAVVKHGLMLHALPAKLDILPLYIVLLALFPAIYFGMRWNMGAVLGASAALWVAANIFPELNLTNWMDGGGWYLNPFAWQFLFVLGAAGARLLAAKGGSFPRIPWLWWACWAYILFAVIAAAPWASWTIADFHPFVLPTSNKTALGPLRLLHVLAIMYVCLSSVRFLAFTRNPWLAPVDACGRHSLEVFSLATLLALVFGLMTTSFGTGWAMQVAVNGLGLAALIGLAMGMEWHKHRQSPPPIPDPGGQLARPS